MKSLSLIFKFVIVPLSALLGMVYSFDSYVIGRAGTVVEPVKQKVDVIFESAKLHQERVERELIMIRSQNDELKNVLIKGSR